MSSLQCGTNEPTGPSSPASCSLDQEPGATASRPLAVPSPFGRACPRSASATATAAVCPGGGPVRCAFVGHDGRPDARAPARRILVLFQPLCGAHPCSEGHAVGQRAQPSSSSSSWAPGPQAERKPHTTHTHHTTQRGTQTHARRRAHWGRGGMRFCGNISQLSRLVSVPSTDIRLSANLPEPHVPRACACRCKPTTGHTHTPPPPPVCTAYLNACCVRSGVLCVRGGCCPCSCCSCRCCLSAVSSAAAPQPPGTGTGQQGTGDCGRAEDRTGPEGIART
jgi:hypothetical protein